MLHHVIVILCFAALICVAYLLISLLIHWRCRMALRREGREIPENGELSVYAEAETLEYALRCAVLASNGGRITVVVNIRHDDKDREEMIDMTEKLARTNSNIYYRII